MTPSTSSWPGAPRCSRRAKWLPSFAGSPRFPSRLERDRHDVSLLLGMLMGVEGLAAGAEDILGRLANDAGSSEGERVCAQVFLATMVQWRPRADVSLDMANPALELLEHVGDAQIPTIMNLSHPASLETMAVLSRGRAHFQAGDLDQARVWLNRGLATRGATYPVWKVSGLGSLGLLEAWCGNTERAVALSDEALAIAKEVGLLAHPCIAEAYMTSALVAMEKGEPGHASLALHEGIVRSEANRRSQLSWFGHLESALLQEADGKRELAMETVLSARSDLGAAPPPVVADRLAALQARLLRLGGSAEAAQRSLRNASPTRPRWHSSSRQPHSRSATSTWPANSSTRSPFLRCGRTAGNGTRPPAGRLALRDRWLL